MQFVTPVDIAKSPIQIDHTKEVVLLGSCFADNIGRRMQEAKFNVLVNPFGTLYNPMSIAWILERTLEGALFTPQSEELFKDGEGTWHSWMHHTDFSAQTAEELCRNMNKAGRQAAEALRHAGTLIVTLGTAIIYTLKADGRLVANCHKQKDSLFDRRRLGTEEITDRWTALLRQLRQANPGLRVILTVSPIRHMRDGFHVNQLSKSTLLLAADQILQKCKDDPSMPDTAYFPSYEIMMDELRDYRFYADDMVHPSPTAVSHIWERFTQTHFSRETLSLIDQCEKIAKALSHRPSHPESPVYKAFIENTLRQIQTTVNNHPYIRMDKEIEKCNTLLEK